MGQCEHLPSFSDYVFSQSDVMTWRGTHTTAVVSVKRALHWSFGWETKQKEERERRKQPHHYGLFVDVNAAAARSHGWAFVHTSNRRSVHRVGSFCFRLQRFVTRWKKMFTQDLLWTGAKSTAAPSVVVWRSIGRHGTEQGSPTHLVAPVNYLRRLWGMF